LAAGDDGEAENQLLELAENGNWRAMTMLANLYGSRGFAAESSFYYEQARV